MNKSFEELSKAYSIPFAISIREASEILGINSQEVRKQCANGTLIAAQSFPGSGKWMLKTEQFEGAANWGTFLESRLLIKERSLKFAELMLDTSEENDIN